MTKRLKYRGEIVATPDEYEAGRFKVHLFKGKEEIGLISGYVYSPDSFITYGHVLEYADEMDEDEYIIIEEAVELIEKDSRKDPFAKFKELFVIGIATIDRVYIRPEYRQQGYAKEAMTNIRRVIKKLFKEEFFIAGLIAHAFELELSESASELSLDYVQYSDDESYTDKLVKLYEGVGFKVVREMHGQGNAKVMIYMPGE